MSTKTADCLSELTSQTLSVEEIFEVFPDLVFVLNGDNVILEFKAGNEQDLYLPPEQFLGHSMCDVLPVEASTKIQSAIDGAKKDNHVHSVDYRLIIQDKIKWFEARVRCSNKNRIIVLVRDITENKHKEKQILHQATHDYLTGLYNRAFALDYVDQKLKESHRQGSKVALLFLDLDNFKHINDTYGHEEGDKVLIAVASLIRSSFREQDLVSRIGGDEFLVAVAGDFEESDIHDLTNKLCLNVQTSVSNISLSVGVAITDKGKLSVSELLKQADMAMYKHKRLSKDAAK